MLPMGFGTSRRHPDYQRHGTTTLSLPQRARRRGHRPMQAPPSSSGVPRLPAAHRSQCTGPARHPSCRRQLRHSQTSQSQSVARTPGALAHHFTPTYASWLNQVERFFAFITQRATSGLFHSTADLIKKIDRSFAPTMQIRSPSCGLLLPTDFGNSRDLSANSGTDTTQEHFRSQLNRAPPTF